jgi:Putative zinc-finger
MTSCHEIGEDLTAWIEDQLPTRRRERVRAHLSACAPCAAEADSLRTAIAWQQRALRAVSVLDNIDAAAMKAGLRRGLAAEAAEVAAAWTVRDVWASMWGRLALAGVTVSLVVLVVLLAIGPGMVLMPLGLESPPQAVAQHTEFFKDYPLIEQLDVLEHFDTVESVPLDDGEARKRG